MAEERKELQKAEPLDAERVEQAPAFIPAVDIVETDDRALLTVDLPGCDESSVEVHLEEGVLTVRGRVKPDDFPGHDLTYSEYRVGDFERTFTVSELVDSEKIEAKVRNGVLELTLPKVAAAQPKKIQVKVK